MNVSVELTLSPLQDQYEAEIIRFIKALRASGLTVLENPLSTQVFGEYREVMSLLQEEMERSLQRVEQAVFFIKMVKTDRSDYEPHF
ncbi:thiamine-binding protein [Robiginitalea sp. M366]|uniref:thiamine-binding protein n=1 Tax=Robiginitalea aestuariiviva TaxID=3036903 RepID=UPI00240D06AC|nr:thiamine-binding protein [Robiginitalea aestuariiviva]MDG1571726.1 thiamine-binding protein [Robiginitalea aestuariiviva]